MALAILDVGGYRPMMETYGMDRAHGLLAEVTTIAKPHLRDMDLLARYSADQFILCLPGLSMDEARALFNTIASEVRARAGAGSRVSPDLRGGGVLLVTEEHKRRPVQDLIAAAGHQLIEAQALAEATIILAPLDT